MWAILELGPDEARHERLHRVAVGRSGRDQSVANSQPNSAGKACSAGALSLNSSSGDFHVGHF